MPALKTGAAAQTTPVSNRHHAAHQARLIVCIEIRKGFVPDPGVAGDPAIRSGQAPLPEMGFGFSKRW
jgi:hypothetical protein